MSAKNRARSKSRERDLYETPEWCLKALHDNVGANDLGPKSIVLDPSAGSGNIVRFFRGKILGVRGIEIDANTASDPSISIGNALACPWHSDASAIVMNPPYTHARQFVEKALQTKLPMFALLRLNWIAPRKSKDILDAFGMPKIIVLSSRPSFTNDGRTDAAEYAWFCWNVSDGTQGKISVAYDKKPKKERVKHE